MTASNFEVNTFTGGLNMDSDNSVIKNDQYKYAENIRMILVLLVYCKIQKVLKNII